MGQYFCKQACFRQYMDVMCIAEWKKFLLSYAALARQHKSHFVGMKLSICCLCVEMSAIPLLSMSVRAKQ